MGERSVEFNETLDWIRAHSFYLSSEDRTNVSSAVIKARDELGVNLTLQNLFYRNDGSPDLDDTYFNDADGSCAGGASFLFVALVLRAMATDAMG